MNTCLKYLAELGQFLIYASNEEHYALSIIGEIIELATFQSPLELQNKEDKKLLGQMELYLTLLFEQTLTIITTF